MKCVLSASQARHYPESFLVNGERQPNPESPDRVDRLLRGALAAGLEQTEPRDYGLAAIARVHTPEYLAFLRNAYTRWSRIAGAASEVTPNIHPTNRDCVYPASVVAQAGYHMADASAPIGADTWGSALASAWSAIHASEIVMAGEPVAYALSRPPGHHAGADIAGGFCYLNNTAIAAEQLRTRYRSVAILDIDLHHGNGTQSIFYHRADVLTVSLHADPVRFYPFFWGHAAERGVGAGLGYNLNLPLPRGTGDEPYLQALEEAFARIEAFSPDALVIALGLDGFEGDPIAGLSISSRGYGTIGQTIAGRLRLPTVIIQEGGYPCEELADNLTKFLTGMQAGAV
ncbi:MAG: histone deacetylase family protein [Halieaceae bacterium]|jgi:acetoin utilization deacetylase AcuC-like enzyme|nr:histone deacetylase family protein [Halieaceae bacterium]